MPSRIEHEHPGGISRHEHYVHVRPFQIQLRGQFNAADTRHLHVREQQMNGAFMLSRLPKGILSAWGEEHGVFAAQQPRKKAEDCLVVVDDKDGLGRCF